MAKSISEGTEKVFDELKKGFAQDVSNQQNVQLGRWCRHFGAGEGLGVSCEAHFGAGLGVEVRGGWRGADTLGLVWWFKGRWSGADVLGLVGGLG